jgi:hypothetical protein
MYYDQQTVPTENEIMDSLKESVQDEKFWFVSRLLAAYREQSEEFRSVLKQRDGREFV